jgi:hypothetical protein
MALGWSGPEQRREPRIDVLMRVRGQLVAVDTPVIVHDLSRSGFSVISQRPFGPGETLDFRLAGDGDTEVRVSARAVHTKPLPNAPGLHFSGFMFVPGRLTGLVPKALIDTLIATVAGSPTPCF